MMAQIPGDYDDCHPVFSSSKLAMKQIQMIAKIFLKPHPFIFNAYSVIIPGALAFLIIALLAPLQFQEIEGTRRILIGGLIGFLVSATVFCSVQLLRKIFPKFMDEDEWTIGREILLYLIVISLIIGGIFASIYMIYREDESFARFFTRTAFLTLVMSLFPVLVLVLFEQYSYQKKQLRQAHQLTRVLQAENHNLKSAKVSQIILKAENGKIELQLSPADLVCLRSDSNYVEVFYRLEETCTRKLIRNRLKHLEEALPKQHFFRCHNSFIVNGEHIMKVEGNARNLDLLLKGIDFKIPVSRSKAKAVTYFLAALA